jgi:hypothetical protein
MSGGKDLSIFLMIEDVSGFGGHPGAGDVCPVHVDDNSLHLREVIKGGVGQDPREERGIPSSVPVRADPVPDARAPVPGGWIEPCAAHKVAGGGLEDRELEILSSLKGDPSTSMSSKLRIPPGKVLNPDEPPAQLGKTGLDSG